MRAVSAPRPEVPVEGPGRRPVLALLILLSWLPLLAAAPGTAARDTGARDTADQDTGARETGAPITTTLFNTDSDPDSRSRLEPALTPGLIQSKIKEVESSAAIDATTAARLVELYRQALSNLEEIKVLEAQARTYMQALETAPAETQELQERREQLVQAATDAEGSPSESPDRSAADAAKPPQPGAETASTPLPEGLTLEQVEQQLTQELAEITSTESILAELNKVAETNAQEPNRARKRLAEANAALDRVNAELAAIEASGLTPLEAQARGWVLETERDKLRAELLMLDQRILSAGVRAERNLARRALAEEKLKQLRARRARLENQADLLRQREAERVRSEIAAAEQNLTDAHPLVRELAHENSEFSTVLGTLTSRLDRFDETQAEITDSRGRIEEDYRGARQRLQAAGLSRALGQSLVTQFYNLPDPQSLSSQSADYADEIATTNLNLVRYRDLLRHDNQLSARVQDAIASLPSADRPKLRRGLDEQLARRDELLRRLIATEESYLRGLTELDADTQALIRLVREYREFLGQRLLWVRSVVPVTEQPFAALPLALAWLIAPENWRPLPGMLWQQFKRSPLLWLGLATVLLLLWKGPALRKRIRQDGEPLRRVSTDRFHYTFDALVMTLLLALPWPLFLVLISSPLVSSPAATDFSKAIGAALGSVGGGLYYLRAFHQLCRTGGLADRHFRWSTATLTLIRANFTWATLVLPPLGVIAGTFVIHPDPNFSGTLGRLAMLALILAFTAFTMRLVNPRSGVFADHLRNHPTSWFSRLRYLWYGSLIAVPLFLAGLTLTGYLYTAGILIEALISELWLILGLVVVHQLIVRWLIVTRRGLTLKAALEQRAGQNAEATPKETPTDKAPERSVDLAALDEQTRRLINSMIVIAGAIGLWLIWSGVLPALSLLDQVTLWHYSTKIDGAETLVPVTLADVGLLLLIIAAVIVAARNLPALLEIILLRHTEVTPGMRYTVTTLTGYSITAFGVLLVFSTLGLSWSQVQWLFAALSVGIGFGLQEIVANFISGLIILFERPIRVGDVVTIGDTTGQVTRIQIRATTIRNWDKQELLVPNKEFITGRLLNWSLTDKLNRLTIPVGAEYGCDTREALALLAEAAAENPRVLEDPAPLVTFESFGDNALTMVLRCYLNELDCRLSVTSELHQAIDDKFRAAGIGIAFPQRDIHLHASAPIPISMQPTPGRADRSESDAGMPGSDASARHAPNAPEAPAA